MKIKYLTWVIAVAVIFLCFKNKGGMNVDIQIEINNAILKGLNELILPTGEYLIVGTLTIPSGFNLRVENEK